MNDNQIRFRGASDGNHTLGFLGGAFDGPLLQGFSSVVLKTVTGGDAGGLFLKNSRIGIGTTNPTNGRLHVESSFGVGFSYGYLNGGGNTGYCGNCGGDVSIWAQRRVAAEEFNAFSDARIKSVVGISNTENDLMKLMDIKITDYKFIDKVSKGDGVHKKVIAQELELIYPQAVNKIKGVVPNIYKLATIRNGTVEVDNQLKAGDNVQIIMNEKVQLFQVLEANIKYFKIDLDYDGDIFVYGKEVDDFRTVDYEALSMLNVSATQALYNKIKELEKTQKSFESLQSSFEEINLKYDELKSLVDDLKSVKIDIENIKRYNQPTVKN